MEEFSSVYYQIEINKYNIDRLEKKLDQSSLSKDLADTDEYLNKYLPLKIQGMIDDTLFSCLEDQSKHLLLEYENKIFAQLQSNLSNVTHELQKKSYIIPQKDHR